MRFVPIKTAEQQAALMLVGLRDRLIRNRTQLSNAIRGYAAEFGFTAAKGLANLDLLLERSQADESVPELARELFAIQAEEYAQLEPIRKLLKSNRSDVIASGRLILCERAPCGSPNTALLRTAAAFVTRAI